MGKTITAMNLRKTNIYAGILHLLQMAAVLALSNDFALPVTATYMSGPPGSSFAPPIVLFSTPVWVASRQTKRPTPSPCSGSWPVGT